MPNPKPRPRAGSPTASPKAKAAPKAKGGAQTKGDAQTKGGAQTKRGAKSGAQSGARAGSGTKVAQGGTTRRPARPARSATARAAPGARPGWMLPAAVVGVVVALLLVAVIASKLGGSGGDGDLAQTRPVQVTGTPLPVRSEGGTDPAVGMAAPAVSGASFDGRPVEIGSTGRSTMVFFVAHWCPHCQREVPLLAPELGRITPPGVEVLTVATSTKRSSPNYPPSKWLREEGWPSTVLADDAAGSAAEAYGLSSFPFYVLIGGGGKVVSRGSGEKSVAEVEALLTQVAPAPAG